MIAVTLRRHLLLTRCSMLCLTVAIAATHAARGEAQALGAAIPHPNLAGNIDRPIRYRPDGSDFVIENGGEFFNRSLYGGNTAFRVDGGDKPEFVLYLPGRGGNLKFGVMSPNGARWLSDAAHVVTRYRPGSLRYEIHDPLLGERGVLRLTALAYHVTEGLVIRLDVDSVAGGVHIVWAYGGVNGQRGTRDGDIGTEKVPISTWFQLQPSFATDNAVELGDAAFTLRARPATIAGIVPAGAQLAIADAKDWNDLAALTTVLPSRPALPVVVGRIPAINGRPLYVSLQRLAAQPAETDDLPVYREVTRDSSLAGRPISTGRLAGRYSHEDLPHLFTATERHFDSLRARVSVDTPDPYLNAAVGALNVAGDAVWDGPQQGIMHGAIAWRTRLLGWRGPYLLDDLGWHDRAASHFRYWANRQNTSSVPARLPPADENANLARNETGLHSNGDMSASHYDMNAVYIDALFRHLQWTGDTSLARQLWPTIERHLAWERRLFRRAFGPDSLPLYEAYAMIWASDDLGYNGGGATHASAYNYYHNVQAARLARLLHHDPTPYDREATLIARGMRSQLWLPSGGFGEYRDLLALGRLHPSAALWSYYHTMDSQLPSPREAWQMTEKVIAEIPRLPVRGPGVPDGLYTLASSNWMPYSWSINNVVMGEAVHTALGFWQAGRADDAWTLTRGSLLAAMYMGIAPGNVGSMSYLDVYRRESQRDFADGAGVLSRALIEGLFGMRPDALAGELLVEPGFPSTWRHATLTHPDVSLRFTSAASSDRYAIEQRFARPQSLRLRLVARLDRVASVTIGGRPVRWSVVEEAAGMPRIEVTAPAAARFDVAVRWTGAPLRQTGWSPRGGTFARASQGQMRWWAPAAPKPGEREARSHSSAVAAATPASSPGDTVRHADYDPVDLGRAFNDRVTQIFKHEYRAPRSPFVSLATPKQGIGAWAGHVNETVEIDDHGLRALSAANGGRIRLPRGVPLVTPGDSASANVIFTSRWTNYPQEATVPLTGYARRVVLLMAGSTNHMQSRIDNGEVVVTYADGSTSRLALENPTTWWPIEKDYFIDDFQFRYPGPLPLRVDLLTGTVRALDIDTFKGAGGPVRGGSATVLELPLQSRKRLMSITVRALSNEVVIGLMAATLVR